MKIFDFEHVQLLPKRCIVSSRAECDTSIKFGKHTFKVPITPSNMKSILDEELSVDLARNGYFYVMHRFNIDNIAFVKRCQKEKVISSISIGVKDEHYKEVEALAKAKLIPDYITIDIAHGHAETVRDMIFHIREHMGDETFIIAGNIATPQAVNDLERWGADATKIGVGPGKVCITRYKTGFGTGGWQLSAIKWVSKAATKPIIADGGVRQHGDIAKAIRFGATMVMAGSIYSGHTENPGEIIEKDGIKYKEYFGSASEFNKTEIKNIEGKKELVPYKGSLWDTLKFIQQDLQSSISYAGGTTLDSIRTVSYILLTYAEGY